MAKIIHVAGVTQPLHPIQVIDGKKYKICTGCNELLPIAQFNAKSKYNPSPKPKCIACMIQVGRKAAEKRKLKLSYDNY